MAGKYMHTDHTTCCKCSEFQRHAPLSSESSDYLLFLCGVECYHYWRKIHGIEDEECYISPVLRRIV